jgi:hypothetical protein
VSVINWTQIEAIGAWVGALGQIATATVIFLYTKESDRRQAQFTEKTTRALMAKNYGDMINAWNVMVVSSPEHLKAATALRKNVRDPITDSIVFSYLNCMVAFTTLHSEGIVTEDAASAKLENAIRLLEGLTDDELKNYLSRGYDEVFKERILLAINKQRMLSLPKRH